MSPPSAVGVVVRMVMPGRCQPWQRMHNPDPTSGGGNQVLPVVGSGLREACGALVRQFKNFDLLSFHLKPPSDCTVYQLDHRKATISDITEGLAVLRGQEQSVPDPQPILDDPLNIDNVKVTGEHEDSLVKSRPLY